MLPRNCFIYLSNEDGNTLELSLSEGEFQIDCIEYGNHYYLMTSSRCPGNNVRFVASRWIITSICSLREKYEKTKDASNMTYWIFICDVVNELGWLQRSVFALKVWNCIHVFTVHRLWIWMSISLPNNTLNRFIRNTALSQAAFSTHGNTLVKIQRKLCFIYAMINRFAVWN